MTLRANLKIVTNKNLGTTFTCMRMKSTYFTVSVYFLDHSIYINISIKVASYWISKISYFRLLSLIENEWTGMIVRQHGILSNADDILLVAGVLFLILQKEYEVQLLQSNFLGSSLLSYHVKRLIFFRGASSIYTRIFRRIGQVFHN